MLVLIVLSLNKLLRIRYLHNLYQYNWGISGLLLSRVIGEYVHHYLKLVNQIHS